MSTGLLAILVAWLQAVPAHAATLDARYKARQEKLFQRWIQDQWPRAKANGISRKVFDNAFRGVKLDWSLPDLAPPGIEKKKDKTPRRQPEFGSPGVYFKQNNLNALATIGSRLRKKHGDLLKKIEAQYGVPGPMVLALWGRETSYGRAKIPYYALRSLATLSFIGRRRSFFHPEVFAALKILQEGHITRAKMKSSWAGAMGHTQMLPKLFRKYAVDFDGDGRRDIWNSIPDALATSARYLKSKEWNSKEDWGYEVNVPANVPCFIEGPERRARISEWMRVGVTRTRGRSFNEKHADIKVSLLMPAGRFGPAFLVTKNFYVLKTYNNSDLYALYLGHTADRIYTNRPFEGKWGKVSSRTRAMVKALQEHLISLGYDPGGTDGLIGYKTRVSVGQFQKKKAMAVDCWPGPAVFKAATN